jgi:hypothetical protein
MERHAFVSEVKNSENRPKTFRDFYVFLMDYFLDNMESNSDSSILAGNESVNGEIKLTV